MPRQELEAKGVVKREQAIAHLEEVLSHLKSGGVCLTLGEESACLAVPDVVKLKIEAECKSDKGSLALEIGWKSEMREETGLELAISAPPAGGCCQAAELKKKDEKAPATEQRSKITARLGWSEPESRLRIPGSARSTRGCRSRNDDSTHPDSSVVGAQEEPSMISSSGR